MSITTELRIPLIELYVAIAGRAPDASGLSYWANEMETKGYSIDAIAAFMYDTEDARALYPREMSADEIATAFYQNVLGREPDVPGLNYWTDTLNQLGVVDTLQHMIHAVKTYTGDDAAGLASQQLFADKTVLSEHLALSLQSNDLQLARNSFNQLAAGSSVEDVIASLDEEAQYTLTDAADTAQANRFNAAAGTLQSEDALTGSGSQPSLSAEIFNPDSTDTLSLAPQLNQIAELSLRFTGTGTHSALDLSNSTGTLDTLAISTLANTLKAVAVTNIANLPAEIALANIQQDISAQYSSDHLKSDLALSFTPAALAAANSSTTLSLNDVHLSNLGLNVTGDSRHRLETLNLISTGTTNLLDSLDIPELQTLNITGDQALRIGYDLLKPGYYGPIALTQGGISTGNDTLHTLNASALTGNLHLYLADQATEAFSLTAGSGDDTLVLDYLGSQYTLDGGAGFNTLVLRGNQAIQAHNSPHLSNIQAVEIRTGRDTLNPEDYWSLEETDVVNLDAKAFDSLNRILVRNEGLLQDGDYFREMPEGMIVNLFNLSTRQAESIVVEHSNAPNGSLHKNVLNLHSDIDADDNRVQVELIDTALMPETGMGLQLNAVSAEQLTLVDNSSRFNAVYLADSLHTYNGSRLTLLGGANRDEDTALVINAPDTDIEHYQALNFETIQAAEYQGNLTLHVSALIDSQPTRIYSGSGNDQFTLHTQPGAQEALTDSMAIAAGTGLDTLIINANNTGGGFDLHTADWTGLSGIDQLHLDLWSPRHSNWNPDYQDSPTSYLTLDDRFISQSDSGNRVMIVNDDGEARDNYETDLVLDLRGLSQDKWVTYKGADYYGAEYGIASSAHSFSHIKLDDVSANLNMVLDGGYGKASSQSNNNTLEIVNTAQLSLGDLSQMQNFATLRFSSDKHSTQTLSLTLDNPILGALVSTEWTATDANSEKRLQLFAEDNSNAASTLWLDASALTGFHALDIHGSAAGDDLFILSANTGGSGHTLNAGTSNGDRINWVGGTADAQLTLDLGSDELNGGFARFEQGMLSTTHRIDGIDIVDLTGLSYASSTITGTAANETFVAGNGQDTLTGGAGADSFVFTAATESTAETPDTITDFSSGTDTLNLAAVFNAAGLTSVAITTAANALSGALDEFAGNAIALQDDGTDTWVYIDANADNRFSAGDMLIQLAGVTGMTVPLATDFVI